MNTDQIRKKLSLGEGSKADFKMKSITPHQIGEVVCGFLNTSGGYLICSIDALIAEVPIAGDSEAAISFIEAELWQKLTPKALVEVQFLESEHLVFEAPKGHDVPYAFDGAIYIREGGSTLKADAETIRDMVMRREIEPERWERRFSMADLEENVSLDEVRAALKDAKQAGRTFLKETDDVISVLERFSASKYGRLTNGGDILFCQNPAQRLPQARVRAMAYDSDKAGDNFLDMKSIEGPLHTVFRDAYAFIARNTSSASSFIKNKPKREDTPLYPEGAVREALINALAHRDYSSSSGGVAIHIYPRRLEIWNSGPLPKGVTVKNLSKGHISVLRNPDIAHVLYLRGLMEKAGRGSVLMVRQCEENGLASPVWTSDKTRGVTVTFSSEAVKSKRPLKLNERQKLLLEHISSGESISRQDYEEQFASDVTERTARRDLSELEDHDLLNLQGSGPTTSYIRTEVES